MPASNKEEILYLRELFTDKPHLTVSEAVNECMKNDMPYNTTLISSVRRNVRERLGHNVLEIVPTPPPLPPPEKKTLLPPKPTLAVPTVDDLYKSIMLTPESPESRRARKKKFVEDEALNSPLITPTELTKKVKAAFNNEGAEVKTILEAIRLARELAGIPARTPKPAHLPKPKMKEPKPMAAIQPPKKEEDHKPTPISRVNESYVLSWDSSDGKKYDTVGKAELEAFILRLMAKDMRNIKLHKEVSFKIKTSMDIG